MGTHRVCCGHIERSGQHAQPMCTCICTYIPTYVCSSLFNPHEIMFSDMAAED